MVIDYKNRNLERVILGVNAVAVIAVGLLLVTLYGFREPLVSIDILDWAQIAFIVYFLVEKLVRLYNSVSKKSWLIANWFQIPFFLLMVLVLYWTGGENEIQFAGQLSQRNVLSIFLFLQMIVKLGKTAISFAAASGANPMRSLLAAFIIVILIGSGLLMLPNATTLPGSIDYIDALFTSTSAVCVTGLIVLDTGSDFTMFGQIVILTLIQLGGLGIMIFGAVIALLLGQALSIRESVAMQDLLSYETLSRIGVMVGFIFTVTIGIEALGAIALFPMWDKAPTWNGTVEQQWFASIFHSISAYCNAGFALQPDSLMGYRSQHQPYTVICSLIILGGLGFGVLYNLANISVDRFKRLLKSIFSRHFRFSSGLPKRMRLQTKIVVFTTLALILLGTGGLFFFEKYIAGNADFSMLDAFFQSVTARTAGFNTVEIGELTESNKLLLMLMMFIGGSPGSTSGGIKTVTFALIVGTAIASLRKRSEVDFFGRSVKMYIIREAVTVTLLFSLVMVTVIFALSVTERNSSYGLVDIAFEGVSALGTVGLSAGVTDTLTTAGKFIIICAMFIGRLGPLALFAALMFNRKPAKYSYPDEAVIVG